jgi:hypothetical protein
MPIFNKTWRVEVHPTITAGAYSAGDAVGGAMKFLVTSPGGGGMIERVKVLDAGNQKAALTLYIFRADLVTPVADNGAFAVVIADLQNLVSVVQVAAADYITVSSLAYAIRGRVTDGSPTTPFQALNIPYKLDHEYLWIYAVCSGTPTYPAATNLYIEMTGWAD